MGGIGGSSPHHVGADLPPAGHHEEARRAGLEDLIRRYWKPTYRYIRAAWAKSSEDAKDLTQAFFLWTMEKDVLSRFQPQRGGLRIYIKFMLRNFVRNQDEALRRLKRGGGVRLLPLDDESLLWKSVSRIRRPLRRRSSTRHGGENSSRRHHLRPQPLPVPWEGDGVPIFEAYDLSTARSVPHTTILGRVRAHVQGSGSGPAVRARGDSERSGSACAVSSPASPS